MQAADYTRQNLRNHASEQDKMVAWLQLAINQQRTNREQAVKLAWNSIPNFRKRAPSIRESVTRTAWKSTSAHNAARFGFAMRNTRAYDPRSRMGPLPLRINGWTGRDEQEVNSCNS